MPRAKLAPSLGQQPRPLRLGALVSTKCTGGTLSLSTGTRVARASREHPTP